jgi:hypothetical protein
MSTIIEIQCRELIRECLRMDLMKRDLYSRHELVLKEFSEISSPTSTEIEYVIYTLEDVLINATTCFREVVRSLKKHVTVEFIEMCKKKNLESLLRQRMKRVVSHWFRNNKTQIFTRTSYKDYLSIMKLIFG